MPVQFAARRVRSSLRGPVGWSGVLLTAVLGVGGLMVWAQRDGWSAEAARLAAATRTPEATAEAKARLQMQSQYLASDELEGRGVGTKGLTIAAEYIQSEFAKAGLDVTRVNGKGLQTFDMITGAKLGETSALKFVGPEGKTITLELGKDFEVCSFAGSGVIDAEVVFAGYGIEDKDIPYNDFADVDVTGKVVIFLRRNPQQSNPKSSFASGHGGSRHADLRTKMSQATQHKAAAVLFVNDPYSVKQKAETRSNGLHKAQAEVTELAAKWLGVDAAKTEEAEAARNQLDAAVKKWKTLKDASANPVDDELMKFGYAGHGDDKPVPPAFHVTQAQINALLKETLKKTVSDLEAEIDSDRKPRTAVLAGWKVQATASVERVRSDVSNVIGVLEGEGPLAEETIVIGAHYDHVGRGGSNSLSPGSSDVHNGADDNASGTASLLELARRLGARPQKFPRRLVFIAFTAEELGLIGSARYVKEPIFPLDKTIAMFNMDMVGRLQEEKLIVYGTGTSPRWEPELKALNEQAKFQLSFKPEGFGPSDHSSFYGKKIPVLHLFTGTHPDYHKPSDDADKLNIDGMLRIVDLLEQVVVQTAQNPERPAYLEVKQTANPMRSGNRPYFGTIPDFGVEGDGYAISGAAPGSPADKGGLKGGDRIINISGNKIVSLDDFDLALRKFKAGEEITVTVLRGGKEVALKVTLEAPR